MNTKNLPLQRSLCILRCLQRSPATRDELALFVQSEADPTAYEDFSRKADRKMWENDITRLRELGVEIDHYDGAYHLLSYGEFTPVGLTEADLDALAFLAETFAAGTPKSEQIQQLLQRIADWLPANQRNSLTTRRQRLRIDLRRRDETELDSRVEQAIERSLREGRLLRFAYRSPSRADGHPRRHIVQTWSFFFDTMRGHLYLDAYWLSSEGPTGKHKQEKWQKFRADNILPDHIEVLPEKCPPLPPKRPRHSLEYLLSPQIARHGQITRHFDNMQTHETDDGDWVRVTATTDDLFRAVRLLLTYGPNCKVIGGPEARREIEALVKAMASVYSVG